MDVGPGIDWQIVSNYTNFSSFMLWINIRDIPWVILHEAFTEYADVRHRAAVCYDA